MFFVPHGTRKSPIDRFLQIDPGWRQLSRALSRYCQAATTLIDRHAKASIPEPKALAKSRKHIEAWLQHLAFAGSTKGAEMYAYGAAGRFYQAQIGRAKFWAELEAVPVPKRRVADHSTRKNGKSQRERDLPWIKVSVPYWRQEMKAIFYGRTKVDPQRVAAVFARFEAAVRESKRLDILGTFDATGVAEPRLLVALLNGDEKTVRRILHEVGQLDDRLRREGANAQLRQAARHATPEIFAAMLQIWHEEVHHKPSYLGIAWPVFVGGDEAAALAVAKLAGRDVSRG